VKFSSICSESLYLLTPNKNVCCKVVGDFLEAEEETHLRMHLLVKGCSCVYDAAMRNVLHVRGSAVKAVLCLECCVQTWSPSVRKNELQLDRAQRKTVRSCFLPITLSSDWKSLV